MSNLCSFKSLNKLISLLIIPRSILPTVAASVDKMFKDGAVNEAKSFLKLKVKKDMSPAKVIGLKEIEKYSQKKIKVKWLSNKIIKEKIYKFKTLRGWKPKNSNIKDIIRIITE